MKVSGFTFVRNALKYSYPIVESITSILPLCDEYIVNVSDSEDETMNLIKSIRSDKIKIIESKWNLNIREGGRILAEQTNIALSYCKGDWCFYLQADEIVHEDNLDAIRKAMEVNLDNYNVEGLLFDYIHFYGSYKTICLARNWYRREIRIIRNNIGVSSWHDAQSFRIEDRKLKVIHINAKIYHYGWARAAKVMKKKMINFAKLYHNDEWIKKNYVLESDEYCYKVPFRMRYFDGLHPKVMEERVRNANWEFNFKNISWKKDRKNIKNMISYYLEKIIKKRLFERRNYNLISK
ncbi:glycosyltransferase [bacterium]|nr:glycosyltransferase [bacterium]